MNPHLLRKYRQRRDVLGILPIVEGTRTILTCTRATAARYFDSTGTLQTAAINEKVFEYDPVTGLFLGLRRERARTNAIRNNTMVGAVAGVYGAGGSLATNWYGYTVLTGLTLTIVGSSTSNNINYTDLRLQGTASGAGTYDLGFEGAAACASLQNEIWIASAYLQRTAGSTTNISGIKLAIDEYNNAAAWLSAGGSAVLTLATSGNLSAARHEFLRTLVSATTAYSVPKIQITITAAGAVDITLRIGMPQHEKVGSTTSKASSPIATSGSAVARSSDLMSLTSSAFTSLGVGSGGSLFARFKLANAANGGNQFVARMSDNGYNNQIGLGLSSTGYAVITTASGGVFDGLASAGVVLSDNTFAGAAVAYAANDLAISKDGAAVGTDGSATVPSGLTRLDVGSDHVGSNDCEILHLAYLGWLPSRAVNNTLIARAA